MKARFLSLLPTALALTAAACAARPPKKPLSPGPLAGPGARGASFAVATENATATRAALDVLGRGGSAADAAVTAALVLGVTTPVSSGVGGGGFALVWDAKERKSTILDFRETAPKGFDAAGFDPRGPRHGTAVGVPGEIAGLAELHGRWGVRPFAEDVEAAASLADTGFPLSPHMARALSLMGRGIPALPVLGQVFFPHGAALTAGSVTRNPALARTLRAVGKGGKAAFYEGEVARSIVSAAGREGSAMTEEDLRDYRVIERWPLEATWGEYSLLTMPPPSAGGLLLLETFGMFSPAEIGAIDPQKPEGAHALGEVFRAGYADRVRAVGDPEKTPVDVRALLAPTRLAARKASFDARKTRPPEAFVSEDHGTSHLVIVDAQRNVVSLTTTVNNPFGARIVAEEAGVLLNDELTDFLSRKAVEKMGVPGSPGAPLSGARPPSSMTPTLVLKGGVPVLSLGGSGGLRIATGVTQVAWGVLAQGLGVLEAVRRPRVHVNAEGALVLEADAFTRAEQGELAGRGEGVKVEPNLSGVQAVFLRWKGDEVILEPASDPRKFGLAGVE